MDPITPSSSNPSPSVDSLLNDILGGQPSSDVSSAVPATPPPSPDPHSIPTLSLEPDADSLSDRIARQTEKDEAEETVERMHDILQGESASTEEVSPGMTPVVEESRLETVSTMPTMSMDAVPAMSSMPTIPATPMPMAPVAPMAAVPGAPTFNTTSTSQPQVAQVPHDGIPKAGIAAALVVVAVMLAGVGAGVALSGQEQDVRNQAYVAPARAVPTAQQAPEAAVDPGSMVILSNSGENAYNDMKTSYPSAREVTVNAGGLSGVVAQADSEIGSKVLFARLSGVPNAASDKKIVAWAMFANGQYAQIGDVSNVTSNGEVVAFISYENFSDQPLTELVLSEESIAGTSDTSLDVLPTQKVANVAL